MIATIIIFLAVLFVLVLVHEWGHYIVAKKTGMRVDEFGIGFPPKLFGYRKGETEYTLNALPLGGFVRIYGEAIVHEEGEVQSEADRGRAMWQRPAWAQALVLVAGVTMNVLLAWVLYVTIFMIGVPAVVDEATASADAKLYIVEMLPNSPLASEVAPGTVVQGIAAGEASVEKLTPSSFSTFINEHQNETIVVTVEGADGSARTVSVEPVAGLIAEEPERKAVGVALALAEIDKQSFFEALGSASRATWDGLITITVGIGSLFSGLIQGEADLTQVAGPVGIAGMVGDAASYGMVALFSFVAIISLNLAIINMLPFPALDGGRLVLLGIEVATRRPVNPVWAHRLNLFGFVLLMAFMVVVTYNDIARLL